MDDPISGIIAFLLMNFTVTFFVIGVIVAAISVAVRRPARADVLATFLNWFLFFAIGVTYVFNGIMHTVFGDMAAASIGWENNGFQAEVGFASIGVGIVGFMAAPRRMPFSLKLAALVGPACFLWGAAGTHIADIITTGNLAPNNAGPVLYTDILIPIIGFALWTAAYVARRRQAAEAPAPIAVTA
ncbi:MAG: hypothetical protein JSS74_07740 [Actinobacteria bacterium]|nr:hypothetical protein [Actinomycetota bacterium]